MCTAQRYQYMVGTQRSSSTRCVNPGMPDIWYVRILNFVICSQGFGTLLMEEAERIAREEHGSVKIAVISGRCAACYHARPY